MVATDPIGAMMRYRLLDTTRAYALEIRVGDAEFADLAVRHANFYLQCHSAWKIDPLSRGIGVQK
jgi:predicted ATPase